MVEAGVGELLGEAGQRDVMGEDREGERIEGKNDPMCPLYAHEIWRCSGARLCVYVKLCSTASDSHECPSTNFVIRQEVRLLGAGPRARPPHSSDSLSCLDHFTTRRPSVQLVSDTLH